MHLRLTRGVTLTERVEAESGDPEDWSFLRRPALLGLLAVVSICVGASLPSSPFKLEMGGTWFFGVDDWPSTTLMLPGVVAVYGGMILFVRVWFGLFQTLRPAVGCPFAPSPYMLALWILPLLVVAPLFSRDVFSYAAQGEMMSHHINPYHYGPGTLGSGPYVSGVDPLWANTPAPYGPLFLMLAGWSASITFHHALLTDCAPALPVGCRHCPDRLLHPQVGPVVRRDPGPAFVLAVLNPLTLLALVGGAHNDAIMVGLLLAGVTAARVRPPRLGCRAVRARRLHQGAGGHRHRVRRVGLGRAVGRLAPAAPACCCVPASITVAVMGALSLVSGLGWGWIANLGTPGTVRSWMAPATGFGLLISGSAHLVGIGVGLGGVLTAHPGHRPGRRRPPSRSTACAIGSASGMLGALGATMMAFVLLGPVVQPWYLTWGIIIVAPVVTGRWLYARARPVGRGAVHRPHGRERPAERAGAHGPGQHGAGGHGALGRGDLPARQLDDVVADRPVASGRPCRPPAPRSSPEPAP